MKRIVIFMFLILLLVACNDNGSEVSDTYEKNNQETQESGYKILTKVGDKINNPHPGVGSAELVGIKEINETIDLDPIRLTIINIKFIHMEDVNNAAELFWNEKLANKTSFDYVQILYEIENTQEINVSLNYPITAIVLDTGEQIDSFESDIALDPNFGKTMYGKSKNQSHVALIMESNPEKVSEIKVVTGEIYHADTYDTLAKEQSFVFEMN